MKRSNWQWCWPWPGKGSRPWNNLFLAIFFFSLTGCSPERALESAEHTYVTRLAVLEQEKPLSLPPDSLLVLIALTEDQLHILNELAGADPLAQRLEREYIRTLTALRRLQFRPDHYNLAGQAKQILAQAGEPLEHRLKAVGGLLARAPVFYRQGMQCLKDPIPVEDWQLAHRKNHLGFRFLGGELLDSLANCTTIRQSEKQLLLAQIDQARLEIKAYMAFLLSRQAFQADRTIYAQ